MAYQKGGGNASLRGLIKKRDELLADANALTRAIELVTDGLVARKQKTHRGVLEQALELEQDRQERAPAETRRKSYRLAGKYTAAAIRKRRKGTTKILRKFSTETPRKPDDVQSILPYVRHGYLIKAKEGGYYRTEKPWTE